jgi:hypothetical protein
MAKRAADGVVSMAESSWPSGRLMGTSRHSATGSMGVKPLQ